MSGIPSKVGFGVTRIDARFVGNEGEELISHGTAFLVRVDDNDAYVTNRHVVDPLLQLGIDAGYRLDWVKLELRRMTGKAAYPETKMFEVSNLAACLRSAETADCAVLFAPQFSGLEAGFSIVPAAASRNALADADWLATKINIMDAASFIGFAGTHDAPWWDTAWNYPIARSCTIASPPDIPFTNAAIRTSDVTLATGFSFGGSSGSPIVAHEKGFKIGGGLGGGPEYVPAKLIGIMSGHFRTPEQQMFRHSGLSYFTRSTSILELLKS